MNKEMIRLKQEDHTTIIELTNEDNNVVFMKYTSHAKRKRQLLFISVDTFKKYWNRNIYEDSSKYAYASESELRKDYKFEKAEEGFSRGCKNPVPVADISLLEHTIQPCIGFTEGITRTIWLIANGFKMIPFEVANNTSNFLSEEGVYTIEQIRTSSYYKDSNIVLTNHGIIRIQNHRFNTNTKILGCGGSGKVRRYVIPSISKDVEDKE